MDLSALAIGIVGAIIGGFFQYKSGSKQSAALIMPAVQNAEAMLMSAQTAAQTSERASQLREQEIQRQATNELCTRQAERLAQLRSDLAELISIAYSTDQIGSQPIEQALRQRAIRLTSQLLITPFPFAPVGMHIWSDKNRLHAALLPTGSGTVEDSALWSRYILNALILMEAEHKHIEAQLVKGQPIERNDVPPKLTTEDTYQIYKR